MKKEKNTLDRKGTRRTPGSYLINFLFNFSLVTNLMDSCNAHVKNRRAILQAKKNYIVSTVTCVETFYHDLLINILEKDDELLEEILCSIKERPKLAEMYGLLRKGVSFAEIAASKKKYQSLEEVEATFGAVFKPKGYLSTLGDYERTCIAPGLSKEPISIKLESDWRRQFGELFKKRHEYVHDANSNVEISDSQLSDIEILVLKVIQLTVAMIAEKYPPATLVTKQGYLRFLTNRDLLMDDWIVSTGVDIRQLKGGREGDATIGSAS